MALNLSTLTSPATSGDVLAEALTTADFLEGVPVLRNLARGSQKGGDAKQSVSLNQPRALPLIKNPAGDLGGYLYIPNVSGNYATGPSVTIGSNETWEAEVDMVITQFGNNLTPFGGGDWSAGFGMLFYHDGSVRLFSKGTGGSPGASGVTLGTAFSAKYGYDGTNIFVDIDGSRKYTGTAGQSGSITHNLELNQQAGITNVGNYAIQKAKLTVNSSVVFDCDFNGSTSIRHGDTKFQASVGGPVSLTRAGQDPVTVVKKDILRFDGVNDGLQGLFNQTITEGYLFAAFSILGNGGESYARMFIINPTGGTDSGHFLGFRLAETETFRSDTGGSGLNYSNMYNDERGDVLYEYKFKSGDTRMRFNNATGLTSSGTVACSAQEFSIAASEIVAQNNASLDLEYLALFPATITDDQAADVVNYINNRNNVFSLVDGFGYYFYDAQSAPVGAISSGSSSWNGRIIGSDNGDTDKLATQATSNDSPVGSGYTVTFADNTDHLDIPQVTQAGWQVVGTSLGTFAYKVNSNAVTELNLLGNLGNASYRQSGQSYGMILLPESATGADIEEARKLLIDRGASDGVSGTSLNQFWRGRTDILEFNSVNTTGVTDMSRAWQDAGLTKFALLDTSSVTNLSSAFANCNLDSFPLIDCSSITQMGYAFYGNNFSDFPAIQAPLCSNFSGVWQSCSALTSFPAGAKLGTSASNVNFTSAWRSSGLTSFSTPLPTAGNCRFSWFGSNLASFNLETLTATEFRSTWRDTNLSSFSTTLPNSISFNGCWIDCSSLTDFDAGVFNDWNPSSIADTVFHNAWDGCTSLTAQSVENILTSIDASGKYATSTGASGGSALGDAGIDIDYNTATGSLSAATNAAIDSLSGKGWQVIVNNVNLSLNNTYSVAFDGTDDYMSMTLPVLGNTHTLSAWFKTTTSYGGAGSEGTLISYISSGGGNDDSVLSVTTNKVGWSDFTDDNQFGTSTVNDGNWHHAVAVVTATTQKIYVDGVLETTTTNAYSAGTSFSSATIGRRANAAQRYFGGNIDEVAIWNSELSATDVTAIYNGGRPLNLNVNTNGYDNSSTLVAWWRMGDNDSGTGSTVTDNSANSYNGTLINGPTFQTNTP